MDFYVRQAHQAGVQRVAQKEGALRAEDELAGKNSARPDLVTVELEHVEKDIIMDPVSDHDNSEDESYQPGDEASDDDAANDASNEEEAVQDFLNKRALEKKKAGKVPKAAIRTEINDAAGVTTLKRKPSAQTTETEPKKSKTALGGLKKGWKKAIEVAKSGRHSLSVREAQICVRLCRDVCRHVGKPCLRDQGTHTLPLPRGQSVVIKAVFGDIIYLSPISTGKSGRVLLSFNDHTTQGCKTAVRLVPHRLLRVWSFSADPANILAIAKVSRRFLPMKIILCPGQNTRTKQVPVCPVL
ncbi:hypothetical protein B0H13DRAFT_1931418 [Mycena leptocephala]|nr:hypothetical protein B0H13DRAFT_1931418 [Mycena leptocephala]